MFACNDDAVLNTNIIITFKRIPPNVPSHSVQYQTHRFKQNSGGS